MQMQMLMAIYGPEFMSSATRHALLGNFFVGFHYLRRNAPNHLLVDRALCGKVSITTGPKDISPNSKGVCNTDAYASRFCTITVNLL